MRLPFEIERTCPGADLGESVNPDGEASSTTQSAAFAGPGRGRTPRSAGGWPPGRAGGGGAAPPASPRPRGGGGGGGVVAPGGAWAVEEEPGRARHSAGVGRGNVVRHPRGELA